MPKKQYNDTIANPKNKKIINEFIRLIDQIKYDMDHASTKKEKLRHSFRLRQINNVIKILKKYPKVIKTGGQLADIKGIGKGTVDRINEILKTGKLKEIKSKSQKKEYLKAVRELEKVIGIGDKIANYLVTKHKIKSVPELITAYKKGKITLNDQILLGLKYYGIYQQNIPRAEINKVDKYINKIAMKMDIEMHVIIAGSYRRKKLISNDIDILLSHPKIKTKKDIKKYPNYLVKFVTLLKNKGFIVDDMTYDKYETKYMGFCRLNKRYPIRRIDIRYVPDKSYYTSLVYFTGSRAFNIKLRNIAISLGYKLNEYGLYKKTNGEYKKIKIKSEKELFNMLGLEYVPPEYR